MMPPLLLDTYVAWKANNGQRMGAALAYYTIFSLAPLLLIVIAIAGAIYGDSETRHIVTDAAQQTVGLENARFLNHLLAQIAKPGKGILASAIGSGTLIIGALGVVAELQESLNCIWKVPAQPTSLGTYLRTRLVSLSFILAISFLLLVSLILSALASRLGKYLGGHMPIPEILLQALNMGLSFAIITMVFALIFKLLPETTIAWRDVWTGAIATALLFSLGNLALGIYVGKKSVTSVYGAAGSLVTIMVWTYYCAQILFFGAEFTHAYAEVRNHMPAE